MIHRLSCPDSELAHCRQGFTLLELIVGLAVMSVGVTVFFSLYGTSLSLTRGATQQTVAAGLAQDQLDAILRAPGDFHWEIPEAAAEAVFPIRLEAEDPPAGNPFAPPAVMPLDRHANRVQENFYSQFRWVAFGRLPSADADYYEVTVAVRWSEGGRPKSIALTSSLPRSAVGGAS